MGDEAIPPAGQDKVDHIGQQGGDLENAGQATWVLAKVATMLVQRSRRRDDDRHDHDDQRPGQAA